MSWKKRTRGMFLLFSPSLPPSLLFLSPSLSEKGKNELSTPAECVLGVETLTNGETHACIRIVAHPTCPTYTIRPSSIGQSRLYIPKDGRFGLDDC